MTKSTPGLHDAVGGPPPKGHPAKTRIFLIEDHPVMRLGIRELLEKNGFLVVGEVDTGQTALSQVAAVRPDVVVIDIRLTNENGLDLIPNVSKLVPEARVIIYSMHQDMAFVRRALNVGARGYVSKQEASQSLILAIQKVMAGEVYLSPALAQKLVAMVAEAKGKVTPPDLSTREREIMYYLSQGYRPAGIGRQLSLSPKTVETYMGRLKAKLGIASNPELSRFCVEHADEWTLPAPPPAPAGQKRRGRRRS
jgi:DNA-binding NarL/FixJ family response regulator